MEHTTQHRKEKTMSGTCNTITDEDVCMNTYDICRCNAAYGQWEAVNGEACCYDRNMGSSSGCYVSPNGSDYRLFTGK